MIQKDTSVEAELQKAEKARQEGNEGRARVCARLAAGIAARNFLFRQGVQLRDSSAYGALKELAEYPNLGDELRTTLDHLTTTVNEAFNLPEGVDLISDARKLIEGLKKDSPPEITIYGAAWCGGSRRVRLLFDQNQIPYRYVDIDRHESAAVYIESLTHGYRSVPTIVWPDGSFLVEPSNEVLAGKLGLKQ